MSCLVEGTLVHPDHRQERQVRCRRRQSAKSPHDVSLTHDWLDARSEEEKNHQEQGVDRIG